MNDIPIDSSLVELEQQLATLSLEQIENLYSEIYGYETRPVDIETFIHSREYLSEYFTGIEFSPFWMEQLKEIYPSPYYSPYWLINIRGSIGAAKTTSAVVGYVYDLYRLQQQKVPQLHLGVNAYTEIEFAILNTTMRAAQDVVWSKMSQMFQQSTYFAKLLEQSQVKQETIKMPKRISLMLGSRVGHTLGRALYEAIIDEANFEHLHGQVRDIFDSILRRMQSRYMKTGGGVPGRIWVVSSEADKDSPLTKIIDAYAGQPGVKVINAKLWEVNRKRYTCGTFSVYTGSDMREPYIVESPQDPMFINEPDNIIKVPEEHRPDFVIDVHKSLRDLAGVATTAKYRLFKLQTKLTSAFKMPALFPEQLQLDSEDDTNQIHNYILNPTYFSHLPKSDIPRHIHFDVALSEDRFGLAASYVVNFKKTQFRNPVTFEVTEEYVPEIVTEWAFGIKALPGQTIPYFKIRLFITWLQQQGYPIAEITADLGSGMAADMLQLIGRLGISTEKQSVDITNLPYMTLRNLVYEGRIHFPLNNILKTELTELIVSPDGKKIDHNESGSKDISDAVCGSAYRAVLSADKYRMSGYQHSNVLPPALQQIAENLDPKMAEFIAQMGWKNNE